MALPNVMFIRPELAFLFEQYYLIRDCLAGETAVKAAGPKYLPIPNEDDQSPENKARYVSYKKRAVFYNVARRTMSGLLGQVFMRTPIIEVPADLEPVVEDASGTGVSLTQQAKKSTALTLAYSRSGIFVDYPRAPEAGVSAEERDSGDYRPTISVYSPMEIINWRVKEKGAREVYSLIVLAEAFVHSDDGFEMKKGLQFRVLSLNAEGHYQQQIWRETNGFSSWDGTKLPKSRSYAPTTETIVPKDAAGNPFKEIPFSFIGSDNNDSDPDNPNFYDLCSLNMAHYRNSADYEESCYITGQPTPVLTGLTREWVEEVLKGKVNFGSRGAIPLPVGGNAELLQATENTMLKEAMDAKESQMIALGAKLVEQKTVQKTAFESKVDATSSASVLSSTSKNVSAAYEWALKIASQFAGSDSASIKFTLNDDFDISRLTPEERAQAIKDWQAGAITFEEMRNIMRKAGVATEDDKEAKDKIAEEQVASLKLEAPFNTPTGNAPPKA